MTHGKSPHQIASKSAMDQLPDFFHDAPLALRQHLVGSGKYNKPKMQTALLFLAVKIVKAKDGFRSETVYLGELELLAWLVQELWRCEASPHRPWIPSWVGPPATGKLFPLGANGAFFEEPQNSHIFLPRNCAILSCFMTCWIIWAVVARDGRPLAQHAAAWPPL